MTLLVVRSAGRFCLLTTRLDARL